MKFAGSRGELSFDSRILGTDSERKELRTDVFSSEVNESLEIGRSLGLTKEDAIAVLQAKITEMSEVTVELPEGTLAQWAETDGRVLATQLGKEEVPVIFKKES